MGDLLKKYIDELHNVHDRKQYDMCIQRLHQDLLQNNCNVETVQEIRAKGQYMVNQFSQKSTQENMIRAKENLLFYLEKKLQENKEKDVSLHKYLENYLQNFYFFIELMREITPHKKSTLKVEHLQGLQINNEYDLQHLLYAVLKPLCPDARVEVTEDTGFGTVRSDIKIPSLGAVIETKYTKETKSVKKLTEEIEADIVHYNAEHIYFLIYDRHKIIKDRQAFEVTYNKLFDGKRIYTVILQPICI